MAGHPRQSNGVLSEQPVRRRRTECESKDDDGIVVSVAFVYILHCADNSLYVGHTEELASREQTHNLGHGANYTADRRPVQMVYAEEHGSLTSAIGRERQLKRWTVAKKEALIRGELGALKALSRQ